MLILKATPDNHVGFYATLPSGFASHTFTGLHIATVDVRAGAVADFNQDGFDDVFICNVGAGQNQLFFGSSALPPGVLPDANMQLAGFDVVGAASTTAAAAADFNWDGAIDLVVVNENEPNEVFFGDGAGAFTAIDDLPSTLVQASMAVAVGDFDGDGMVSQSHTVLPWLRQRRMLPISDCCAALTVALPNSRPMFTSQTRSRRAPPRPGRTANVSCVWGAHQSLLRQRRRPVGVTAVVCRPTSSTASTSARTGTRSGPASAGAGGAITLARSTPSSRRSAAAG